MFSNILFHVHSFNKFIVSSCYEAGSVQGADVITKKNNPWSLSFERVI